MEFSDDDDEGEFVAQSVTDYHFVNDKEVLVSFTVLPIQWGGESGGILEPFEGQVFLRGTADNGLQKIFKQVVAWRFELVDENPEISVFSKEKIWIKLEKPRKSFEFVIRGVLITLHCLGFVKKNSQISGRLLWENLRRVFSTYEVRPCEDDLKHHLLLISEVVKRDTVLSKSKFLLMLLENEKKRKTPVEHPHSALPIKKYKFLVDEDEDDSDKDVCAICDNGGALVCCDGRCLRSFHGTEADGKKSKCESLGLSEAQLEGNFMCANCQYKQHQCYACGRLGSSDKNFSPEVFPCVSATCGHFYHPKCVAKLLHPNPRDETSRQALQNKIGAGEPFTCPAHRCHACKKSENLDVKDLCFALCRRCPKTYHRRCLHRKIAFQSVKDQGIIRRAWDGLLPNRRVMIYCLKHDIDESLQTPFRNIIFPEGPQQTLNPLSRKRRIVKKKKFVRLENLHSEKIVTKKTKHDLKRFDINNGSNRMPESLSGENLDSKLNVISKQPIINNLIQLKKLCAVDANGVLIREGGSLHEEPELGKCNPENVSISEYEETITHDMLLEKQECSSPSSLDSETKEKVLTLMQEVAPSVTSVVVKNHLVPSSCTFPSEVLVDMTIRLGRVDNYVKAAQIALLMLEVGYSIEEAKAICGPESLNQLLKSRNKLKVYLAPFLHGTHYTSFGRHFPKAEKLKEIVDKLHLYVKNDDVIVDFCCGANDFSWLIKEKLYESGKNCSFINYDIIQPKNDFDFEKRDWMSVRPAELPAGSKLIMGLNPPFGFKAALANKFIDKALEFEPKLLVLIVPEETERLDKKKPAYDLIWEDGEILSGKSFYLPGSEDACDYQMEQRNVKPPRLYLWSRSDWTTEHISIAHKHGHLSKDVVEEHADLYEAELNHPVDASPNHKEPVEIIKFTREHCEITVQTNGLLEENDEEKIEENESTAPLKCAAELNHPVDACSNHKEPVDIFEFKREHCDIAVQTNCLLEKNDEEKIEENESTAPLKSAAELNHPIDVSSNHKEPVDIFEFTREHSDIAVQTNRVLEEHDEEKIEETEITTLINSVDESSLPKYSKCDRLGGVETKEDTNPSVMRESPEKQLDKNDEKQSEKETSAVPISCKKSSSRKHPSCNKHGGFDTKDLAEHSVRNWVLKKKYKKKRKKFEEEKSSVPNFFDNRSLPKDAKRSKRDGYDANDYNDHGVLRNSLNKKSKGHKRGKQSRGGGILRSRGQNDCDWSQDAKLPFRAPRRHSLYSWADAETLPGGYPHESYWSPHGTSHTFSDNEMGCGRVGTSNQGDDFGERPWNYSAAYTSGRHEWSDGLHGSHPQEACWSASPRRASGMDHEVGYRRVTTSSQGDDDIDDRLSKKRTPSANKRAKWSAGNRGGWKKYGTRGSYGGRHGWSKFDERNERGVQQHYRNYDLQSDYYYSAERRYPHDPRDDRFGAMDDSLSYTPCGVQDLVSNSGYGRMSFSAMDKYAPQLDELNPRRVDFHEPETVRSRSSMVEGYGSHYPHDGYHGRQPYSY